MHKGLKLVLKANKWYRVWMPEWLIWRSQELPEGSSGERGGRALVEQRQPEVRPGR